MATILISGGTGLIGLPLAGMLKQQGHRIHLLSRKSNPVAPYDAVFRWDVSAGFIEEAALEGVDIIVHLAGEGIADKRWTPERKLAIVNSRIESARLILEVLKKRNHTIDAFISGSATGWYGAYTDTLLHTEAEPAASDFLGETCRQWEWMADQFAPLAKRIVKIRTGVVLAREGGALPQLARPIRWFAGSPLGSGKQQIPWIHLDDVCRIFHQAITDAQWNGSINATASENCTNKAFTQQVAAVLNRPLLPFPVPSLAIKMLFGEMSAVVLEGSRISNQKLKSLGFAFQYSDLGLALRSLL